MNSSSPIKNQIPKNPSLNPRYPELIKVMAPLKIFQVRKCEFCCDGNNNNKHVTNNKRRGSTMNRGTHCTYIKAKRMVPWYVARQCREPEVVIEECVFQLLDEAESEIYAVFI
ncbi:hypothetical protein CEXT_548981 [Caerostris extrusa]|uniref:Uncharacterized protein n=1 Tax=Caerostris extrusa TaxID=172846 RepID=A0AAV4XTA5_CAEEX|nr:hypothetical protein CEXT_548981 [Caerostris extrusa]